MKSSDRRTGVLLHITSLPSQYGVGDIGEEAYRFVDSISENGITLWQILPLGPTGYGESPYASRSSFAGNPLLISPKELYMKGYLDLDDAMKKAPESERVDYSEARKLKMPMLFRAAENFLSRAPEDEKKKYKAFLKEESSWLEDYALFEALCAKYNDSRWFSEWPDELKKRTPKALEKAKKEQKRIIEIYSVLQYFFFEQWKALKSYANEKGVKIIGDIPFYVAADSSDAWANTKLLDFDENNTQLSSAGVPPDAFSTTGQLWGNPFYKWEEHEKTDYEWWMNRIKKVGSMCDIIRIDHFRAFEAGWRVPQEEKTAINGKWVKGPGQRFFDKVKETFGDSIEIIAEDLGIITKDVEKLRDDNNLPGMDIMQFAFSFKDDGSFDSSNSYLPHNVKENSVIYTGTHDNNTTRGWYNSLDDKTKDIVRRYFECSDGEVVWKMMRGAMMSSAKWAIFPLQDILSLGEEARMNTPSTCGSFNWSWRMKSEDITSPSFNGIKYFSSLYGRA